MSKEQDKARARIEGMEYALKLAKEKGIEALEQEVKWRNASGIGCRISREELNEASDAIKLRTLDTVLALASLTLRDEFDFGKTRLKRFIERFNSKTEFIADGEVTWDDILDVIKDEVNIDLGIRFK